MENSEDKIVMDILKLLVDDLYSYINSKEFSNRILQEAPNLSTFPKTRIEGEIQSRMADAVTAWLNTNVHKVVDSVFHDIIPRNADSHEEIINVFENLEGVSTFSNDGSLGLQDVVLTAASSLSWIGYSAAVVGPLLPGILTGLGLYKAVSVGIRYVSNILPEADAIIKYSFKTRVESMDKESLKTFFDQHYDKHLRKFYLNILRERLPAVENNLSFALEEMRKDAYRHDTELNNIKEMSLSMGQFQEDVMNLLESVDTKRSEV